MKSLRCTAAAVLGLSVGLMACPEKKADPILPKAVEVKPPVVVAPPQAAEPHADKECADDDGSIYRYDRAGLLMALKSASAGGKGR